MPGGCGEQFVGVIFCQLSQIGKSSVLSSEKKLVLIATVIKIKFTLRWSRPRTRQALTWIPTTAGRSILISLLFRTRPQKFYEFSFTSYVLQGYLYCFPTERMIVSVSVSFLISNHAVIVFDVFSAWDCTVFGTNVSMFDFPWLLLCRHQVFEKIMQV